LKDWVNDEMVRVCRISQNLKANTNNDQANIKSDHNEKMDVCQKVKFLEQQLEKNFFLIKSVKYKHHLETKTKLHLKKKANALLF
jgi:hypothetical protein